jgi:hypothetical protein
LWRQVAVACSHCRVEFTRAACDSLHNSTRAEPRKRRRRCAPPSTHTTCHHQLNPNTYITHTCLSLADTPYRDKQYEIDNYLASNITPFFRGIGLLSIYTSAFVHCPLFDGFLAAGSVESFGSQQPACWVIATSSYTWGRTRYSHSDSTLKLKLRLGLDTRPSSPKLLTSAGSRHCSPKCLSRQHSSSTMSSTSWHLAFW